MKRFIIPALAIFIAVNITGCDAIQRKFTRKKKYVKPVPRLHQLKKYDVKPSTALYSKHYAYWQSWMSEMIQDLGQNHKKDVRSINEALNQIDDMRNILVREKAEEMDKYIRRLEDVKQTIVNESLSQYNRNRVTMILEQTDRTIKRDFSPVRVKDYIRESFEDAPVAKDRQDPDAAVAALSTSVPR